MQYRVSIASILLFVSWAAGAQEPRQDPVRARFETLDEAGDMPGIVALWRENPARVLGTIDGYLEGALALWEKAPETADAAAIAKMHARARRGAAAADEAFGTVSFGDYAASFAGWNIEQKKAFRGGQKAFGDGMKAIKAKEFQAALEHAKRCLELSSPLGDWWGMAMGLSCMGSALQGLGQAVEALECHSKARLINHDLRLIGAEMSNTETIVMLCVELGRRERGEAALAVFRKLAGDDRRHAERLSKLEALFQAPAGEREE